jgi:hypothetical protein
MRRRHGQPRRRVTGIELPTVLGTGGGGAEWEVLPDDREVLHTLVREVSGRRVLTDPVMLEDAALVKSSVRDIREMAR